MSTNLTTAAFEIMASRVDHCLTDPRLYIKVEGEDIKKLQAVVRKYRKLEEYLKVIEGASHKYFPGDEFTEVNDILRNIYLHASCAIEYDPLTLL